MRYLILFGHAYCFYFYACTSCNTQFAGLDICDRLLIRAFSAGSPAVKNNDISLMLRENRLETMLMHMYTVTYQCKADTNFYYVLLRFYPNMSA